MSGDTLFVYLGTYTGEAAAKEDLADIQEQHARGFIGTYDAAVVTKDEHGDVHTHKHEKPTVHGAWGGLAAGAVVGVLFPPAIIGSALLGGAAGGVIGHLWRGISRHDVRELGDFLDAGQAALVVVGHDEYAERIPLSMERATARTEKALRVDKNAFEQALREASQELGREQKAADPTA
jgi:uncharacterized membrane protein